MNKKRHNDKMCISIDRDLVSKLIKLKEPGKTYSEIIERLYFFFLESQGQELNPVIFQND